MRLFNNKRENYVPCNRRALLGAVLLAIFLIALYTFGIFETLPTRTQSQVIGGIAVDLKHSKFLKILLFVIIGIVVLLCGFKIAAVLHNDPPAKTETITDEKEYLSVNRYVKNTMEADLEGSLPNHIPKESTAAKYYYNYVCGLLGDPSYIISLKCQFNDVQDMSDEYQRLVQLKPESIKKTSNEEIFIFKCHPVDIERYFLYHR